MRIYLWLSFYGVISWSVLTNKFIYFIKNILLFNPYIFFSNNRKPIITTSTLPMLYTKLGIDSSVKEKKETKLKSRKIYKAINKIDNILGKLFLQSMDS